MSNAIDIFVADTINVCVCNDCIVVINRFGILIRLSGTNGMNWISLVDHDIIKACIFFNILHGQ